jgi:hypothetical protein
MSCRIAGSDSPGSASDRKSSDRWPNTALNSSSTVSTSRGDAWGSTAIWWSVGLGCRSPPLTPAAPIRFGIWKKSPASAGGESILPSARPSTSSVAGRALCRRGRFQPPGCQANSRPSLIGLLQFLDPRVDRRVGSGCAPAPRRKLRGLRQNSCRPPAPRSPVRCPPTGDPEC